MHVCGRGGVILGVCACLCECVWVCMHGACVYMCACRHMFVYAWVYESSVGVSHCVQLHESTGSCPVVI